MPRRNGGPARGSPWRRQILIVSLKIQNPTFAAQKGKVTDGSFVVEPMETAAGLPKPGSHVAIATLDLPEKIMVWEIFVRLSAKDILHCRAVYRSWRRLTFAKEFLLNHHRA
jgi:hypothetical protein